MSEARTRLPSTLLVWPGTLLVSLLAALTTWVTLLAWSGFAERPAAYLAPLLGACLVVAVLGAVLRSARLPALVVALVQVVVVLLWLQQGYGGAQALGGWIPTPASLRTTLETVQQASVAAQSYAAPVPASAVAFNPLMVVAGVSTAVLVDFLAVGLRQVPLAGLPLLAAYTAPVSILDGGVPWLSFTAAALCFLFLVAAEHGGRLTHWGRRLTPGAGLLELNTAVVAPGGLWSSARKIGFTATALAVVVPVFVPAFGGTLFGGDSGSGDGTGGAVSISNPMVDLRRDLSRGADTDLLSVTTREPDPSYLRLTVLDTFDGNAWRPSDRDIPIEQRADGAVPRPAGLAANVATQEYASTITTNPNFESRWLPTPYPAVSVEAPGDWRYDTSTLDFISATDGATAADLSYRVRSLEVRPTAAQLADAAGSPILVTQPNTELPRDFPRSVSRLAESVTTGQRTAFEKAVALQQWFRVDGGFRYSLARAPGNGTDDLVRFLSTGKDGRVGYCEQFAAAMAVMGRSLGIPSRVAVGFLRPERQGSSYVYSSHDLHAWPEMYFGGVGWVRFEPTPQARTGAVPGYTTQQVPQQAPSSSVSSAPSTAPGANQANRLGDQQAAAQQASRSSSSSSTVGLSALGLVLLVVLLLAPRALRALVRRRRRQWAEDPRDWVENGWREIADTARDLGIGWDDQVTLRTAAAALEQRFGDPMDPLATSARPPRGPDLDPAAVQALHRLVGLLERARYARELPPGATTAQGVDADVHSCVQAMRAGAGRRRVLRARWLPASLTTSLTARRHRPMRTSRRLGGSGVDRAV